MALNFLKRILASVASALYTACMDQLKISFNPEPLIRLRGEVSKSAFARKVGVSSMVYSNWERGQCPAGDNLYRIVKTFNLPLDALFTSAPIEPPVPQAEGISLAG